jgi:hypothetical protein
LCGFGSAQLVSAEKSQEKKQPFHDHLEQSSEYRVQRRSAGPCRIALLRPAPANTFTIIQIPYAPEKVLISQLAMGILNLNT